VPATTLPTLRGGMGVVGASASAGEAGGIAPHLVANQRKQESGNDSRKVHIKNARGSSCNRAQALRGSH